MARIPSHRIAPSPMALSLFALRLPGSQHHTGFWSLKPVRFCQAAPYPRARRGPSRLPPPGPVLFMRLLSGVAGATMDLCPTLSPATFGPFHALDTAAAPVFCLGNPLGRNPSTWMFTSTPSPHDSELSHLAPARGPFSWLCRVE